MKKDIFNGKIATECIGLVKFTLILTSIAFISFGIIFLLIAIFYENVEYAARIFLYCCAPLSIIMGISFPLIVLHLIKIYPKHRKITKVFIQEWVFRGAAGYIQKDRYKD